MLCIVRHQGNAHSNTVRLHVPPTGGRHQKVSPVLVGVGNQNSHTLPAGVENGEVTSEGTVSSLNTQLPFDPTVPLLVYSQEK